MIGPKEKREVHRGKDSEGTYYKWGLTGKKYYYTVGNNTSRLAAMEKAKKQKIAAAIHTFRR